MAIPVYQVTVPEYRLRTFRKKSRKLDYAGTPWFNLKIPQVYWENKPDFEKIGAKIDSYLKKHFIGKKVAVRVLGSEEHKGKSIVEVIRIIKNWVMTDIIQKEGAIDMKILIITT